MTLHEAIERLIGYNEENQFQLTRNGNSAGLIEEIKKDIAMNGMAIEALQKQMPMRPIITGGYAECPKCHADVNSTMWYCAGTYYDMGCGQQLDWSDEE